MDATLKNLFDKFGKYMGTRIYACALIQKEKMDEKAQDGEVLDMLDAVRYTIGMVKRMRRQSIENGGNMSWDNAIDRLEAEQVEARHYTFKGAKARETARIEKVNSTKYKEAKWSAMIEAEAERIEAEQTDKAYNASDVSIWLHQFMSTLSKKRLAWFTTVLAGLRRGQALTMRQRQAISNRYTPDGVKPEEFMELVVRYA